MVSGVRSIPKHTHRLFLSYNLIAGQQQEPAVTNRDFLGSFLDAGVWIRVVNAAGQLSALQSAASTPIQKLSALAGFYQQAGLQTEDALSNLVAWAAWSKDPSMNLADLLDRISLRTSRPREQLPDRYHEVVCERLVTSKKRVEIYVREYASSLLSVSDRTLPALLGIPWNRNPSVKDVGKPQRQAWDNLPAVIKQLLLNLLGPNGELLASCYNKIKHGPQIVVAESLLAIRARGLPAEACDVADPTVAQRTIRLLLHGSRTQETPEELAESRRVAPFLYADPDNARRWLLQSLLHTAGVLSSLATWLFNFRFRESPRAFGVSDPFLESLVKEQQLHLERTFPDQW